jgi:hypothetical protein
MISIITIGETFVIVHNNLIIKVSINLQGINKNNYKKFSNRRKNVNYT